MTEGTSINSTYRARGIRQSQTPRITRVVSIRDEVPVPDFKSDDQSCERRRGSGKPAIHHGPNHHLSTFWRQRRILMSVHSMPRESLKLATSAFTARVEWTTS
jgi:hypothetical protein